MWEIVRLINEQEEVKMLTDEEFNKIVGDSPIEK
jgi:hypothetical protein